MMFLYICHLSYIYFGGVCVCVGVRGVVLGLESLVILDKQRVCLQNMLDLNKWRFESTQVGNTMNIKALYIIFGSSFWLT